MGISLNQKKVKLIASLNTIPVPALSGCDTTSADLLTSVTADRTFDLRKMEEGLDEVEAGAKKRRLFRKVSSFSSSSPSSPSFLLKLFQRTRERERRNREKDMDA